MVGELPEKLTRNIEVDQSGCWVWTAFRNHDGYGRRYWNGRQKFVHRIVYESLVGKVPPKMELDHLCRVRACCNPAHLEIVTHKQNMERGLHNGGRNNREKTHCINGHAFTEANTYWRTDMRHGRICRTCRNNASHKAHGKTYTFMDDSWRGVERACSQCGSTFIPRTKKNAYCSEVCKQTFCNKRYRPRIKLGADHAKIEDVLVKAKLK